VSNLLFSVLIIDVSEAAGLLMGDVGSWISIISDVSDVPDDCSGVNSGGATDDVAGFGNSGCDFDVSGVVLLLLLVSA
jgi:hypothetical protein